MGGGRKRLEPGSRTGLDGVSRGDGRAAVAALSVFPVKSLRGGDRDSISVEQSGFAGDRRWMVVDAAHRFMTQRDHPRMARVQAQIDANGLVLLAADLGTCAVEAAAPGGHPISVTIWNDVVLARDCGETAAAWLSTALAAPCRLVHLADPGARRVRAAYAETGRETVSFADGFPVLLMSASSLADVNSRLVNPVTMRRFRPNVVVEGTVPWVEDTWRRVRIGEAVFRVAKPCDRCIMTTLDPDTGLQPDGNEPLRTMSMFRRNASGSVMFGQNLVPERLGTIRVGDEVEVLEAGGSNVFFQG